VTDLQDRSEKDDRPEDDDRPEILRKLEERRERHQRRGRLHRAAVVVSGVFLILGGIVLSGPGVPGPGFLVILLGLSFLALEFDRAERLLEKVILWADAWGDRIERLPKWVKITASVLGVLGLAAFVVAAILWDIPLLPL
jgi:Putative transmembrane protein (PGPGW)